MRAMLGVVGLIVALGLVGVLVKKQVSATRAPAPSLQTAPASAPTATVRDQSQQSQQSQQIQQQVKQQMEGLMQQARPLPDESK